MKRFNCYDNLPKGAKKYSKLTPIRAVKINEPFEVITKEGLMKGKKGDWLAKGIMGENYIIDNQIFSQTYTELEE